MVGLVLRGVYVDPRDVQIGSRTAGSSLLTGEVETRGKALRLVEYIERVPGVTSVHSELTYRLDDDPPRGVPPARRL